MEIALACGVAAGWQRTPYPQAFARWEDRATLHLSNGVDVVSFRNCPPGRLAQAADELAMRLPAEADDGIVLLLAHCALTKRAPDEREISVASAVRRAWLDQLPPFRPGPVESLRDLRTRVRRIVDADHPSTDWHGAVLGFPAERWSACRFVVLLAGTLWLLRGAAARWWGSAPIGITREGCGGVLSLALLAEAMMPPQLGLPVAAREESLIDYLSVAGGPDPLPQALVQPGIGASELRSRAFNGDGLELSVDHAHALNRLAAGLLATADRPLPRYQRRVLDISIPPDLLPRLGQWGVAGILVDPRTTGMYVALLDGPGMMLAPAWWQAESSSGDRWPLSVPSACWALLHPVLAAFWHDLCADTIIVDVPGVESYTTGQREPAGLFTRRSRRHQRVFLPPVRARVHWAAPHEEQMLQQLAYVDVGYRRLPAGWEDRQTRRDFQERRAEAAARARSHGWLEPPEGFTFVRPFTRGVVRNPDGGAVRVQDLKVRSRGLFTLYIGLFGAEAASDA